MLWAAPILITHTLRDRAAQCSSFFWRPWACLRDFPLFKGKLSVLFLLMCVINDTSFQAYPEANSYIWQQNCQHNYAGKSKSPGFPHLTHWRSTAAATARAAATVLLHCQRSLIFEWHSHPQLYINLTQCCIFLPQPATALFNGPLLIAEKWFITSSHIHLQMHFLVQIISECLSA